MLIASKSKGMTWSRLSDGKMGRNFTLKASLSFHVNPRICRRMGKHQVHTKEQNIGGRKSSRRLVTSIEPSATWN